MALLYPQYLVWRRTMEGVHSADDCFSKKMMNRMRKSWKVLADSPYRLVRDEIVDDTYLNQFVPLYEKHIGAKKNGHIYPVRERVHEGQAKGHIYEALSLYQDEVLIGGFIYSIRRDALSACFRAFPHELPLALPLSVSHLAEHLYFARALELGKHYLRHGKDRNAYGLHSNIGLAEYKLRLGCDPWVSQSEDTTLLPVPPSCEGTDALFFLHATKDKVPMREALLVSDKSTEELLTAFPTLLGSPERCRVTRVRHEDLPSFLAKY